MTITRMRIYDIICAMSCLIRARSSSALRRCRCYYAYVDMRAVDARQRDMRDYLMLLMSAYAV